MSRRQRYYTRKEIAAANEISDDTIARREHELGLDKHRDHACRRPVRYAAAGAAECLRSNCMNLPE